MFDTYSEIFADRAASYHRAMRDCPRARNAEFAAVIEPLGDPPGAVLCDLPSGGGYLAEHLPSRMHYIGVDPSDDFIAACPAGLERICAEITAVPLPDQSVDYIVSLAALHHEPDLPAVFDEMHRLLRRGGRAVVADVAVATGPAAFLNGFVAQNNPMGHDGRFLAEDLPRLAERAGFRVSDDRLMHTPWRFRSQEEAGEFCRNLFWMPGLDAQATARAMDQEIGFDSTGGSTLLKWVLRRIVCDSI
jgi:SAM-dependent methyltransferase